MKFKKIMFVGILLLAIFAIGAVSASDVNDTAIANEDTSQIELSTSNEITEDNLQTSEENNILTQTNNNESVGTGTNSESLGEDIGTYSGLHDEIQYGGNIELKHKYYKYDSGTTIEITGDNRVIDGKGAVIDMAESTIRAFTVSASSVTIKNLTIKNANYNGDGGAIYFSNSGTVTNCNFVNNTAPDESNSGGAICFNFRSSGTVTNCNFTDNSAYYGGAVYFYGEGNVTNCNFSGNYAYSQGGAIFLLRNSNVSNCNFTNNRAYLGGAVYFLYGNGEVTNCNFIDNAVTCNGGAVFMESGNVENCNFVNNTANNGGAIYMSTNDYNVSSSIFLLNKNVFNRAMVFDNCVFWFGNNASNYDTKLHNYIDSWLFLDATSTPVVGVEGKSSIVFNLKLYNSTSKLITTPDTSDLPNIVLDLSASNGYLNKYSARLDENIIFTSTIYKEGIVTAKYNDASYSIKIINFNLEAPDVTKYASGDERFIAYVTDSSHNPISNINVTISIDSETHTGATDSNGQFSIPLNYNPGNYTVTTSSEGLIILSKVIIKNTILDANDVSGTYKNTTFKATILDSNGQPVANKKVTFKVNENEFFATTDANGVVMVNINLNAGEYIINTINPITGETKSNNIIINKANSTVSVYADPFKHGVVLTAVVPSDVSGVVSFIVNGNNYYDADIIDSKATITLNNLDVGNYTVKAKYAGNINYESSLSPLINFKVDEDHININAPDITKAYGDSQKFIITLTENDVPIKNADVKITINEVDYIKTTDNNGKISMDVNNLDRGIYGAVINYADVSKTSIITINKLSTNVVLSLIKHLNNTVILTANLNSSDVSGNVIFTVNNKDYPKQISGSKAVLTLNNLNVGNYTAKATYGGDKNHESSVSSEITFDIDEYYIIISAPDVTKYYGGLDKFIVTVTDNYNDSLSNIPIRITANGQVYNRTSDLNGQILMDFDLNPGTYDIITEHDDISVSSTFNIKSTIVAMDVEGIYQSTVFKATFLNSSGNALINQIVKFNINGNDMNVKTDNNGVASINIALNTGNYKIMSMNDVTGENKSNNVKINKLSSTIAASAVTTVYNGGKYIIATIKDSYGNPLVGVKVTVKIGTKTFTPTTDKTGKVKVTTNNLAPVKTYEATITFAGNNNYAKSTTTTKITVKKATPKLTANKKTFKKSVKTKKYTIILKDNQNKVMKNTKVTIKVNKKTYTAKTNAKGKATFKIKKLTKKGTYKATLTYKGNSYYNKVTKKVNIKIK